MHDELFEAVNANAARAAERDRAANAAASAQRAHEERRQKLRHRRADLGVFVRLILTLIIGKVLGRLTLAGAMNFEVATGLLVLWTAYVGFYAGVWWHYRFGEEWCPIWF